MRRTLVTAERGVVLQIDDSTGTLYSTGTFDTAQVEATQPETVLLTAGGGGPADTVVVTAVGIDSGGNFVVAHGLGYSPSFAVLTPSSLGTIGLVSWDGADFYLVASANGVSANIVAWR